MLASFSAAPALQAAMETAKIAFAPSSLYHSGQEEKPNQNGSYYVQKMEH